MPCEVPPMGPVPCEGAALGLLPCEVEPVGPLPCGAELGPRAANSPEARPGIRHIGSRKDPEERMGARKASVGVIGSRKGPEPVVAVGTSPIMSCSWKDNLPPLPVRETCRTPRIDASVVLDDTWAWRPNTDAAPFEPGKLKEEAFDAEGTPFHPSITPAWLKEREFDQSENTWGMSPGEWDESVDPWSLPPPAHEMDPWSLPPAEAEYGGLHEGLQDTFPQEWNRARRKPVRRKSEFKVFVGGLAGHTTSKTLEEYFSQFQSVLHASVLSDMHSCRSRGFGFVSFADMVPELVLTQEHQIDGRLCGCRLYHQMEPRISK